MKTVHVDVECTGIVLTFHHPHKNTLNEHNQVGIVSLKFSADEPSSPSPTRLKGASDSLPIDSLSIRISKLDALKQIAVRDENYDEAKRLKDEILNLRNSEMKASNSGSSKSSLMSYLHADIMTGSDLPAFGRSEESQPPAISMPTPDPLPSYYVRDYPKLVDLLGQDILARIVSRDWRLRDSGIKEVIQDIQQEQQTDSSVISWIVKRCITDKMVNVFVATCDLVQVAISESVVRHTNWDLSDTAEFVVIHLVENRLLDSNHRVLDCVSETLVKIAQSPAAMPQVVFHYLLKHSITTPREIQARCACIANLIDSVGFHPKRGVPLEKTIASLAEWIQGSPSGETRQAVNQVISKAVTALGTQRVENVIESTIHDDRAQQALLHEFRRCPAYLWENTSPTAAASAQAEPRMAGECEFCGVTDVRFFDEAELDLHYWEQCPALMECQFCQQIIELSAMTEHRLNECDHSDLPEAN